MQGQLPCLFLAPISHGSAVHLCIALAALLRGAGFEAAHGSAATAQVLFLLAVRSYSASRAFPHDVTALTLCPLPRTPSDRRTGSVAVAGGRGEAALRASGVRDPSLRPSPHLPTSRHALPIMPIYPARLPTSQPSRARARLLPRHLPRGSGPAASVVDHRRGGGNGFRRARALQHRIRCRDRDPARRSAQGGAAPAARDRARARTVSWTVGDSSSTPLLGSGPERQLRARRDLTEQATAPHRPASHVRLGGRVLPFVIAPLTPLSCLLPTLARRGVEGEERRSPTLSGSPRNRYIHVDQELLAAGARGVARQRTHADAAATRPMRQEGARARRLLPSRRSAREVGDSEVERTPLVGSDEQV